MTPELVVCSTEVADALAAGRPVVALETTIVAHGFLAGEGLAVGREWDSVSAMVARCPQPSVCWMGHFALVSRTSNWRGSQPPGPTPER